MNIFIIFLLNLNSFILLLVHRFTRSSWKILFHSIQILHLALYLLVLFDIWVVIIVVILVNLVVRSSKLLVLLVWHLLLLNIILLLLPTQIARFCLLIIVSIVRVIVIILIFLRWIELLETLALPILASRGVVWRNFLVLVWIIVILVLLCDSWLEIRVCTSERFVSSNIHIVVTEWHPVEIVRYIYLFSAWVGLEIVLIQLFVARILILVAAVYSIL